MPLLDYFEQDQAATLDDARRRLAPALPATFSEAFDASFEHQMLFGNSIAQQNARRRVLQDHTDDIFRKTNTRLPIPGTPLDVEGNTATLEDYNKQLQGVADNFPSLGLKPLTDADIEEMTVRRSREARQDYRAMGEREKTVGGFLGSLAGAGAGALADPVNIATLPLGAARAASILGFALTEAGIAGGSQLAIEAIGSEFHEKIEPGYTATGEPLGNVVEAAAFGGGLALGIKGMAAGWRAARGRQWGREVRDAGNVVESEANIAETNVFRGVEGEVAHRTALQKSIDDMVAGRPVDVEGVVDANVRQATEAKIIEAYHGSPHDFDRFDVSRIGTGEGAQSFGHGLYFAEHPDTATAYRNTLATPKIVATDSTGARFDPNTHPDPSVRDAAAWVAESNGDIGKAISQWEKWNAENPDVNRIGMTGHVLKTWQANGVEFEPTGALYKVRILADKDRMLDWDKPLSEQAPSVRSALQPLVDRELQLIKNARYDTVEGGEPPRITELRTQLESGSIPASELYNRQSGGREATSKKLAEAGIPGIKYLDQGSRGAGDGTRNFVVFSDKDVEIVEKNGRALAVQGLARERGYDMPAAEAATVAARIDSASQDEALGILEEVMLRPRTVADMPPGAAIASPNAEMPRSVRVPEPPRTEITVEGVRRPDLEAKVAAIRQPDIDKIMADPKTRDATITDLDRLRAERGIEQTVPVETIVNGEVTVVRRNLEELVDELDGEIAAAKELRACATLQVGPAE